MRAYVPGFALFTLACGSAATVANNATAEVQSSSAGGDAWAGHYEGPTDGGHGILDIRAGRAPGSYDVRMELTAPGCGGDAEGPGVIRNGRLVVTAPTMTGEQCILEFTRNGSTLRSTERGACSMQHGPSCDFTGTLRRTGAAQSARGSANNGGSQSEVENPATAYAELVRATENGGPVGSMDGRDESSGSPSWIVGAWAINRSECRVVATFTFRSDGTFHTDGDAGTWRLSGNALSLVSTEHTGADGWQSASAQRYSFQVTQTRGGMRMRGPQGTTDLVRC